MEAPVKDELEVAVQTFLDGERRPDCDDDDNFVAVKRADLAALQKTLVQRSAPSYLDELTTKIRDLICDHVAEAVGKAVVAEHAAGGRLAVAMEIEVMARRLVEGVIGTAPYGLVRLDGVGHVVLVSPAFVDDLRQALSLPRAYTNTVPSTEKKP
jgi:predicted RNA-binding Zn ribbon-like protein